jgi:hypothetical protein
MALVVMLVVSAAGCATTSSTTPASTTSRVPAAGQSRVHAVREPLTANRASSVSHDTETLALVPHAGRLFAATGQWMYPGSPAHGQVLVQDSANDPWKVFENTQSLRVQALDSFPIPDDQGLGARHSLLVTAAIVEGRSEVQWLRDDAASFAADDAFPLVSMSAGVRAFGAHEDGGVWSVYAGVAPTGILRGTWSPTKHTLVFDPKPELSTAPSRTRGKQTQKVTGFADCAGALYVSIGTKVFRRNDGDLPPGVSRWARVYQAPPVGSFNSGVRGLTCVAHDGAPSLLLSTEGNGDVLRLDHLPAGRRAEGAPFLVPHLELAPFPAIRRMLAASGTTVPARGPGSIGYVIAAYNDFAPLHRGGGPRQLFGFEWGYVRSCPSTRSCGPTAFHTITYDSAACFAVRSDHGSSPTFDLRCLSGSDFTPTAPTTSPIRGGQAFVSIRTIATSPFGDGRVYYGGYDCNFFPSDGTAWIARSGESAIHLDDPGQEHS